MPRQRTQLSIEQVLAWADAHYKRTGWWPTRRSGPLHKAPGENWMAIASALKIGGRGLPGGKSLAERLTAARGPRQRRPRLTVLTFEQILRWADAHHKRTGDWPMRFSGAVHGVPGETWLKIDSALRIGYRGFPRGGSLARLLAEHRGVRNPTHPPSLTVEQILVWADLHHRRTGQWPTAKSGPVYGSNGRATGETWSAIREALMDARRGLQHATLPMLLAKHRGVRHRMHLPVLTVKKLLAWADAYHKRTGKWPTTTSGAVPESPGDTWLAVDAAIRSGRRWSAEHSSLARVLARYRDKRLYATRPGLTTRQILAWADAHHDRTGNWPMRLSGPVHGVDDESWLAIDSALRSGTRGCSRGSSLARLLTEHRGVRNRIHPPPLTVKQILTWADLHFRRTGQWPKPKSGPVRGPDGQATGETWMAIEQALQTTGRGLQHSTLARFLAQHRGVRHPMYPPALTVKEVLTWADAYRKRTGKWPSARSGSIPESPGDTWLSVGAAMRKGTRWRAERTTLPGLLSRYRNKQHPLELPRLTIKQILAWADQYHRHNRRWPTNKSGPISGTGGETWNRVTVALLEGLRGLPGGSSLPRLLEKHRSVRNIQHLPRLTIKQILKWADAHRKRTGRWPKPQSGDIPGSGGETWHRLQGALFMGLRGLYSGLTIAKVLDKYRGVRNAGDLPALNFRQILRWADAHHRRTGRWPKNRGGRVPEAPGEKWSAINVALLEGLRGLHKGSSLPRLLSRYRRVRNIHDLPPLSTKQVLAWADAHHKREKCWPVHDSGRIPGANGETWNSINSALVRGRRGLRGGSSLAQFLNQHRRPDRGL